MEINEKCVLGILYITKFDECKGSLMDSKFYIYNKI